MFDSWQNQKHSAGWIALLLIPAGSLLTGSLAIEQINGTHYRDLTRDVAVIARQPVYYGVYSQLGIKLWSAAAAIAFVFWRLLSRVSSSSAEPRFYLAASLFTCLLLIDDSFLLHDRLLPSRGIDESWCYGVYLLLVLLGGITFRRVIRQRTHWGLLTFAGLAFFTSIMIDQVETQSDLIETLGEDLAKFTGICAWLTYLAVSGLAATRRLRAEEQPEPISS